MPGKITTTGDFTGQQKAKLEAEREQALKERAEEAYATKQAEIDAAEHEVVDLFNKPAPVVVDEVEEIDDDGEIIRVADDIQEMTVGDEIYNFTAGKKYRVPRNVAFHLREKGRLYDRA